MSSSIRNGIAPSSLATPSRPPPIRDTERDDASTSSADVLSAATLERTPRKEEGQKMKEEGKQMQGNERRMPVAGCGHTSEATSSDDVQFISESIAKEKQPAVATTAVRRETRRQRASTSRLHVPPTQSDETSTRSLPGTRDDPVEIIDSSPEPGPSTILTSPPNKPSANVISLGGRPEGSSVRSTKRKRVESYPDIPPPFKPLSCQTDHLEPVIPSDGTIRMPITDLNLPSTGGGPSHRGQRVKSHRRRGKVTAQQPKETDRQSDVEMNMGSDEEPDASEQIHTMPTAVASQSQSTIAKRARPTWALCVPSPDESDGESPQDPPSTSSIVSTPKMEQVPATPPVVVNRSSRFHSPEEQQQIFLPLPSESRFPSQSKRKEKKSILPTPLDESIPSGSKGKQEEPVVQIITQNVAHPAIPAGNSLGPLSLIGMQRTLSVDVSEKDWMFEDAHAPPASITPSTAQPPTEIAALSPEDTVDKRMPGATSLPQLNQITIVTPSIKAVQPPPAPTFDDAATASASAAAVAFGPETPEDVSMDETTQTTRTADLDAGLSQSALTRTTPFFSGTSFKQQRKHRAAAPTHPLLGYHLPSITTRAAEAVREEASLAEPNVSPAERIAFWKSQVREVREEGGSSPKIEALLNTHNETTDTNSDVNMASPPDYDRGIREKPMELIAHQITDDFFLSTHRSPGSVRIECPSPKTNRDDELLKEFDELSYIRFNDPVVNELNKVSRDPMSSGMAKNVMEAFINRAGGSETAPPIDIDLSYDGTIPTAEYIYSNEMKYDADVDPIKSARGCGCIGPCSENTDCFCLKRQELYYAFDGGEEPAMKGFACTKDGLLRDFQFPVWECGDNCECPPSCQNRVMQKGRSSAADIQLFKTRQKGWGVRAKRDIPMGTFVGIYVGELIREQAAEMRGAIYAVVGRTYLFDLDGWHIRNPPKGLAELDPGLYENAMNAVEELRLGGLNKASEVREKKEGEAHINDREKVAEEDEDEDEDDFGNSVYTVDAFHWGNFTRYINHSCDPNLALSSVYYQDFDVRKPKLCITTRRLVKKGEELTISYSGIEDDSDEAAIHANEAVQAPLKTPPKGRTHKSKVTATSHVETMPGQQRSLPRTCYCKSKNCRGFMWKAAVP